MAIDKELVHPLQGSKYPIVARPYTDDMVVKEKLFTKDEVLAMLTELKTEIEEIEIGNNIPSGFEPVSKTSAFYEGVSASSKVIQQRINAMRKNKT